MNLESLTELGRQMCEELGREWYLTGAGLKTEPEFQSIYERYASLAEDEALEAARASDDPALLEWIVGIRTERAVVDLEERQLTWEQNAVLRVNGDEVPYLRAPIEITNSPDREYRRLLDAERTRVVVEELNQLRRDRFLKEREVVQSLGLGSDYVESISCLSQIDLDSLGVEAERLLQRSEAAYRESLERLARRRLGSEYGELLKSDSGWLFRADRYDAGFEPERMMEVAFRQMREMGLDAAQNGRVRFDTEERPAKQPRAFCSTVRVPEEVYVVLRPRGGHTDYRTFWHELGHAMHFASVDPDRPFRDKRLGDNSVTEGFAMLWDHLTLDPSWLKRYTGLSAGEVGELKFELAVAELYLLRRYAAKLRYELMLHRSPPGEVSQTYAELLTDATAFRFPEGDSLIDVDPGFYAARYLRAWMLEAMMADALRERYDEDWYRNPRAGPFVQHLMSRGQAHAADRLAEEVAGQPLSFDKALERLHSHLN